MVISDICAATYDIFTEFSFESIVILVKELLTNVGRKNFDLPALKFAAFN